MSSYTHMTFDGDHPDRFPPPQTWLTWTSDSGWHYQRVPNPHFDDTQPADWSKNPTEVHAHGVVKSTSLGKVRHHVSLEKAKRNIAGYCRQKYFWKGGTPVYEDRDVNVRNKEGELVTEKRSHFVRFAGGRLVENASPTFSTDWKIFEFVDGEWVLRYEGKRGDIRKDHPLWERVGRRQKVRPHTTVDDQEAYIRKVAEASIRTLHGVA